MANNQTTSSKIRELAEKNASNWAAFSEMMAKQEAAVKSLIGKDDGRARFLKILDTHYNFGKYSRIGAFYNALFGNDDFDGWVTIKLKRVKEEYRSDFKNLIPDAFSEALKHWVETLCREMPEGRDDKESPLPVKFGASLSAVLDAFIETFGWADSEAASGEHVEGEKWDI